MSLRQRHVQREEEVTTNSTVESIVRSLKTLDVYPKAEEEVEIKTTSGGAFSIITLIIIFILFISELSNYLSITTTHSISVDTTLNKKLPIEFDITFYRLRCSTTVIDVMDVSGEQQVDAFTNIQRQRLSPEGQPIGAPYTEAHDAMELRLDMKGEGCRIKGKLLVNKVAGNVHIALGASHARNVKHVHQFMMHEMLAFNASHQIHSFHFGEKYPGMLVPLDGVTNSVTEGTAHFQYFLKVVPTTYTTYSGQLIDTNQFSMNEQIHPIGLLNQFRPDGRKIPGVFFVYDLSPFMVKIKEKSVPFSTFVTGICAIIGGIVTIAGLCDSIIYHGTKILKTTNK